MTSKRFAGILAGVAVVGSLIVAAAWLSVQGDELATLRGHSGVVRTVAVGPAIASGGDDGTVRVWDATTNRASHTLTGHTGKVRAVAFGPGSVLASVGDDRTVRIWDWQTGSASAILEGASKPLECVAVSPDGKEVAAAGAEGIIFLWKLDAPTSPPRTFKGHIKHVHGLGFTPDGKTLTSAGEDGDIRFWDRATGKTTGTLPIGHHHVHGLVVAADGGSLAAALTGGIRRWTLPARREMPAMEGDGMARAVALGPDGKTLATVHEDKTVKLWDAESGKVLAVYRGHHGVPLAVAFDASGKTVVTAAGDGTVKRWSAQK